MPLKESVFEAEHPFLRNEARGYTPSSTETEGGTHGTLFEHSIGDWSWKPKRALVITGPLCTCTLREPVGTSCARHDGTYKAPTLMPSSRNSASCPRVYNRGLTDAELKARYPVGYAAMQQNPARSKEELREPNPYGPAYWPTAQDPKTTFRGHGSTLSTHALLRDRRPETTAWPRAWLNGKRYYGHRRRYEWQMEAYRGFRLCMLRFAWRTFRSEYRAHVAIEVQRAAVAWREVVAADRERWRGYDFPTSRRSTGEYSI